MKNKIKKLIILVIRIILIIFVIISVLHIIKPKRSIYDSVYYALGNDDTSILNNAEYKLISSNEEYVNYVEYLENEYIQNTLEKYKKEMKEMLDNIGKSYSNEYYEKLISEREEELNKRAEKIVIKMKEYENFDFNNNDLLMVESITLGQALHGIQIKDINFDNNELNVYINKSQGGSVGGGDAVLYFLTISKKQMESVTKIQIKSQVKDTTAGNGIAYKPIIYLYPTEETQINVQLGNQEKITCSYPKYITGWNVMAQPNGDLKDIDTNKNLYSLYYESDNVIEFKVEKDGFIVKGEDSAEFLEEKLKILGLTDREAEEFIIYWLPKLESNKYNYIRFATREEIDTNMPLTITPMPDTTIRILMEYKGLENPIEVEKQNLEKTERKGFVAVEWGGTEIK